MPWIRYRIVFRLESPLHVGYRRVGNLMQTRPYVPGKVLWAALTARLVRDAGRGADGKAYREIGEQVHEHFRFGYLWPSLDRKQPCFPWEQDDFDYLFLGSYASTALNDDQGAAEEGTLHETEFIAPRTRTDKPVFLVGDLWVKDGPSDGLVDWKQALRRVRLGGERGYGWGRVRLEGLAEREQVDGNTTIAGHRWKAQGNRIVITVPQGSHLTAHAIAAGDGAVGGLTGPVEPLVGWERKQDGRYRLSEEVHIAYVPGTQASETITVSVGKHGVWRAA
ncbi:MAG: hypothetical protein D6759_05770 [Chloroflexi bacterium]|nr:MAG: hypothetical protein D6759_05770 [Chloroflexota bacterium]